MNVSNVYRRALQALSLALPLLVSPPAWADDCGREGERPCNISERKPSCDINLVEGAGMCVHPACGRENQTPCLPSERVVSDLVLKVPTPLPCDVNLKDDTGVCVHPPCGRLGQRPCTVFVRVPSCDLNLAEVGGSCVRPNCGRLGESPCDLFVKRPTFGPCDVNLIPRNGQCVRPGVPSASAGATSGEVNAAVPVTPPRGARPPPPPPPPRPPRTTAPPPPPPAMAPPSVSPASPQAAGGIESDTDRPGNDMHGFNLAQANPAMCQARCANDAQCVAWTYVKPGVQGPAPRCYLKNAVPVPTRNTCCVSGAKGGVKLLQRLR
jgi:hypothetical protein